MERTPDDDAKGAPRPHRFRIAVSLIVVIVLAAAGFVVLRMFADDSAAMASRALRDYIEDIGARRYSSAFDRLCASRRGDAPLSEFETSVSTPVIEHGGLDKVVVERVDVAEKGRGRRAVVTYRVVWGDGTVWNDQVRLERSGGRWQLCEFAN